MGIEHSIILQVSQEFAIKVLQILSTFCAIFAGWPVMEDLSKVFKLRPCAVCEAPSTGYHFGVLTCEACKVSKLDYTSCQGHLGLE